MPVGVYLATNAEIYEESYLRAIELFAETAGPIQIDVGVSIAYLKITQKQTFTINNSFFVPEGQLKNDY
jgi:hypothetical protein